MVLFIDSNVVLDFLLARNEYQSVKAIFELGKLGKEHECISSNSVTDILYVLKKARKKANEELPAQDRKSRKEIESECNDLVCEFLKILHILDVSDNNIKEAFSLKWDDYEDALQYSVAKANKADYIITTNVRDFEKSEIKVMTASDFIKMLNE